MALSGRRTTYEPKGGQNLAPRQHARLLKPKASSFQQVYRAVAEYRQKFPEKAVTYSGDGFDSNGWAILMAGGSLPNITDAPEGLLKDLALMKVLPLAGSPENQLMLSNGGQSYVIYNASSNAVQLDLSAAKGTFRVYHIYPRNGAQLKAEETVKGGNSISLKNSSSGPEVLWIKKI